MNLRDSENEKFDINQFLMSVHPDQALQFITGAFADWAEEKNRKQLGKFDKIAAMNSYLVLLRHELDSYLLLHFSQTISNRRESLDVSSVSAQTLKMNKNFVCSLMDDMSLDNAMDFLAKATVVWYFSVPEKLFPLMPISLSDTSDEALADAIYVWFKRYFDLWD